MANHNIEMSLKIRTLIGEAVVAGIKTPKEIREYVINNGGPAELAMATVKKVMHTMGLI